MAVEVGGISRLRAWAADRPRLQLVRPTAVLTLMDAPPPPVGDKPLDTVAMSLRHGRPRAAPQQEEAAEADLGSVGAALAAGVGVPLRVGASVRAGVIRVVREELDRDGAGSVRLIGPVLQLRRQLRKARLQHGPHLGVGEDPLVQPSQQRQ